MLSASVELARSVLDAAPDAMIVIDEAGVIRFANRQVSALFGYSHDEIIGQNVERLMPERFKNRHVTHRQHYGIAPRARAMGHGLGLLGRRHDGSEFPVEISLSPILDSERMLVAAAIRDVTDRKREEAEVIAAREAAERANQAKTRFLATASHDLRQPLQTLALLNGALRRMIIHEKAEEALTQQERAIAAMSRLLNALLDISKLESGSVKPESTDFRVATLVDGLRREFATIAASKGLELHAEPSEESAYSDPALVEQILKNLMSNAIKYTRQGTVRLRCEREDGFVRLQVRDTGVGIPADQLPYIYDEFYQVGVATNSSRDGYGLGLSIVQRLVRLLEANLEVSSEVGRGTTFTLSLPVARWQNATTTAQVSTPTTAGTAPSHKTRVLLVEDDPAVRRATQMLLTVEGYRVTAVGSLSEALQSFDSDGAPQLLITDYHLHESELGTQVIAAVRERDAAVRAVLVTGDTSVAIKQMSGDPILRIASKPINADELLSLVAALLAI